MKHFRAFVTLVFFLGCGCVLAEDAAKPQVIIEVSKPLPPAQSLGTAGYGPLEKEGEYLKKVTELPLNLWPAVELPRPRNITDEQWKKLQEERAEEEAGTIAVKDYQLAKQDGKYVGWFGIVRRIDWNEKTGTTSLLLEHKYFDGLTDLHMHIVSIHGAGDFHVDIPSHVQTIPLLGLIRVYGQVTTEKKEDAEIAHITPQYIRVWDWGLFTFMDYGLDKSNPDWVKLRKVSGHDVYSPRPTLKFYEERLGKRELAAPPAPDASAAPGATPATYIVRHFLLEQEPANLTAPIPPTPDQVSITGLQLDGGRCDLAADPKAAPSVTLGQLNTSQREYSGDAIHHICKTLVDLYNKQGYVGIYVEPHPDEIAHTKVDLRDSTHPDLRLVVRIGIVDEIHCVQQDSPQTQAYPVALNSVEDALNLPHVPVEPGQALRSDKADQHAKLLSDHSIQAIFTVQISKKKKGAVDLLIIYLKGVPAPNRGETR